MLYYGPEHPIGLHEDSSDRIGKTEHHIPTHRGVGLSKRRFMKTAMAVALTLLSFAFVAHAEESFTANGSTVVYEKPDSSRWNLVKSENDPQSSKYLLMFKHTPIKDSEGRDIEPVMAIKSEPVRDSSDVAAYSAYKRAQMPFTVKKTLTANDGSFTYPNSVGYEGEYDQGVIHRVLVAHMRHKDAGIQVTCDSTEGVYAQVEPDMRSFMRSITFKE